MLVLSRKCDEKLVITTPAGESIVLTLIQVRHGRASIGIEAPPAIKIMRSELVVDPGAK